MDIEGVIISKLRTIKDERGQVMHMLRNDSPVFKSFGEVYFSTIYENKIKAWHLHKESYLNYVCVVGEVKLVFFMIEKKV
jgi:dTDP-4-dehydrorhamnose 3,5-epimerase